MNNVEKRIEGRGDLKEKEKLIKLADKDKIDFDVENMLLDAIMEKYNQQKEPGETFDSWLKRTPREELIRIELKDGGVISLSEYRKQKEKPKIKKINLSEGDYSRTVAGLTDSEKDRIKELLRMSGVLVGD